MKTKLVLLQATRTLGEAYLSRPEMNFTTLELHEMLLEFFETIKPAFSKRTVVCRT